MIPTKICAYDIDTPLPIIKDPSSASYFLGSLGSLRIDWPRSASFQIDAQNSCWCQGTGNGRPTYSALNYRREFCQLFPTLIIVHNTYFGNIDNAVAMQRSTLVQVNGTVPDECIYRVLQCWLLVVKT